MLCRNPNCPARGRTGEEGKRALIRPSQQRVVSEGRSSSGKRKTLVEGTCPVCKRVTKRWMY